MNPYRSHHFSLMQIIDHHCQEMRRSWNTQSKTPSVEIECVCCSHCSTFWRWEYWEMSRSRKRITSKCQSEVPEPNIRAGTSAPAFHDAGVLALLDDEQRRIFYLGRGQCGQRRQSSEPSHWLFHGISFPDRGFIAITTKNATSLAYALSPIMGTYVGSTSLTDFFANHSPITIIELDQKKESPIAIYLT